MPCEKGSKELRKGRFSTTELPYFITICSYKKAKITSEEIFKASRKAFNWLKENNYIQLICFVVMPDHLHAVFQLTGEKSLSEVISNFKISVYKQVKHIHDKLWQKDFFDHRIRKNEQLFQIIFYCYNNPYKAGIISQEEDYPYWYCNAQIQEELNSKLSFYKDEAKTGKGFHPKRLKTKII
jgi:REP element-mobilizing transposase RayT